MIEKVGNVVLNLKYYDGEDHYSEGVHEDILLDYVKKYKEDEYDGIILGSRLWSVMYHLSHARENIVSFLPVDKSMKVLEIGAGCGAVTGALSRAAGSVTCIDLSKKRSLVNAWRHRDLCNIEIIVGNFCDIEPELSDKYDVITLIGVLEYAQSYVGSPDPFREMLSRAASHLSDNGCLVIAIENKYGLKYFAGCKEDHSDSFFEGIEGYHTFKDAKTFSRQGLKKLIESASLKPFFYYPYPDYKLPHVVFSDHRLPEIHELNRNLNNFDMDRLVVFDEGKVFDELINDGLFAEFSNSFLVTATKASLSADNEEDVFSSDRPIYAKFSDERNSLHRIATVIYEEPAISQPNRGVKKLSISEGSKQHIENLYNIYRELDRLYKDSPLSPNVCELKSGCAEFQYITGTTLEEYLDSLEALGNYPEMLSVISRYCEILRSLATSDFDKSKEFISIFSDIYSGSDKAMFPSNIDLIFSNILFNPDDKNILSPEAASGNSGISHGYLNVLDYEWTFNITVPVSFIIYRALFYYQKGRENGGFSDYLHKCNIDIYEKFGISGAERDRIFPEMEQSFQLYLKKGTTSFELLHEIMPVSTIDLKDLVGDRMSKSNLKNPQVYYSPGGPEGFQPSNYINVLGEYSDKDKSISLNIELGPDVKGLRIDPAEFPCFVSLISLNIAGGEESCNFTISSNGDALSDKTWFFGTDDPQLLLLDLSGEVKTVSIRYRVEELSSSATGDMYSFMESVRQREAALAASKDSGGLRLKLSAVSKLFKNS
ncbi:MAG: class I SAM-dependent methyltransferase [Lachnospiraceae bacterium]|nr:class I SAM-dependent methyltransferase [Lachnospiraceae bacterium]